jgi:tetratricopeptide (TPR) repeat protein
MGSKIQNDLSQLGSADSLFKAGMFAEAEKVYNNVLVKNPRNFHSALRLGYVALLANRLEDAQKWLTEAMELKHEESAPRALMAEVFYRRDEFQRAAPLARAIGREEMAKKLESFTDVLPYQIKGKTKITHLNFVMTDPLPVVQVRVNGSEPVNFFIDTGGAEMIIDTEFAKEVGAVQFGSEMGKFAGGQQAGYQHGRVDSLTMGDFNIKNVPVHVMDVRRFSRPVFGGKRVDGIVGTVLLYHFLASLDYPKGELILRRKTKESLQHFEQDAEAQRCIVVPFWMAGDHYMVAWGTVNKSQRMLFFVDTGLAGGGFTCPESTLKEGGILLQESLTGEGIGGGGRVKAVPFVVDELTLENAKEHGAHGVYIGAFPLENAFGFRIGGLISHGFFRHYSLSLDFAGMRYFLKRKE